MRVRHFARGKLYTIDCPEGTEFVRRSGSDDHLLVPLDGREVLIPADPPELLPLLAESGRCGLSLVGEPEPDLRMAGVACPECGEADVAWLRIEDDVESVRCDRCGAEFGLMVPTTAPVGIAESSPD